MSLLSRLSSFRFVDSGYFSFFLRDDFLPEVKTRSISSNMPHMKLPASHQNVKLYYEIHGEGEVKVLFIMGLRTEGRAWKFQVSNNVFQIYAFTLSS